MKVIQIVPSIAEESSGPSYTVPALCRGLAANGCDVSLSVLDPVPKRNFGFAVHGYSRRRFPHPALGMSPEMLAGLTAEVVGADVVHNSSLWMFPNVYGWAAVEKLRGDRSYSGKIPKLVMQPRGTFSQWALKRHRFRKCVFGHLCGQYDALKATDMWVATAESEADEIRALGYKQPICVLPNGVDLPCVSSNPHSGLTTKRRMFYLSRIHPKKNVGMLIEVWAKLEKDFGDWSLSIVGPDKNNSYADDLKAFAVSLGCRRVVFEGELNGEEKSLFMADSDCMVLPTLSENFGMVVAESLAAGTPVICSHGAPWSGLDGGAGIGCGKSGWWVETTPEAFERAMREAMSMSRVELKSLGANGREWMNRDFSWNGIGKKMKTTYEWLLDQDNVKLPEWVKVD